MGGDPKTRPSLHTQPYKCYVKEDDRQKNKKQKTEESIMFFINFVQLSLGQKTQHRNQ